MRSRLWTEQFDRYRASHPDLTDAQRKVVDDEASVATARSQAAVLKEAVIQAFGEEEAFLLIATLGPADRLTGKENGGESNSVPGCNCSTESNWCSDYCCHYDQPFVVRMCGAYCCNCGTLYMYPCNGRCN
ncbi:bacteriocin fulvocin C-related protein [Streptosporangium sp. NPDC051023]|uniref:bacteriocin fulvocin C-related protein n=1 Tax=Streptosporangium sp. NPDC051023 TaxID=3155410 RepID=UPI00344C3E95